ncbi:hypothetical protein WJX77_011474 [Trebouxia sp. C0004]
MASSLMGDVEASLREFCARPGNKSIIEREQKKQAMRVLQVKQRRDALRFQQKVLQSDVKAQQNVAPFLKHRVLREIVKSFTNSPTDDFENWAKNEQVINTLKEAQRLLDNGYISEEDMEHFLLAHLQRQSSQNGSLASNDTIGHNIGSDHLVLALNQHLTERRQGNQCYRQKHFETALVHYNNARSILEPLASNAAEEQQEIDMNVVKVYLNIAAVHLAQQLFGKAIAWCAKALAKDPQNAKALLRRAKAHLGTHNYQNAATDLSTLVQQDPANLEAHSLLQETRAKEYAHRCK